jgi:phage terminase large subunit GpA-like protein
LREYLHLSSINPAVMAAAQDWWMALTPPPNLSVSQWADHERRLSPEASAEPGRWDTSRAEYQRGIMDAACDPAVHTVVVMSSAQVGKTEILNNVVGYHVDQDPSPTLVLQPTIEMAQTWSKDRLAPMLRDTPALQGKVSDVKSRDGKNTILHKVFDGGHITMAGANSAASLASRPIRIVLCDEVDRYPPSAGTEGDPISLARKRSTTFWNRKLGLFSTPTVKGVSRIEAAFEESDKRRFWVPCPHCKEMQTLRWSQVKWEPGRPDTAAYLCADEGCGTLWTDAERWRAIRSGEWRAEAPFNGTAGFHLSELYSPWVRLADTARAFIEAKGNPERLKTWVNTSLGETWEERGEEVDQHDLLKRAEDWEAAPAGVLLITCGVDVQGDRVEIERVGWGLDEESWSLEHEVIYGDPSSPELWTDLDDYLHRDTETADGRFLSVSAACVDSGGHYTDAVYRFVKDKTGRRIWALKGMAGAGRPVWPKLASKNNKGRIALFIVGVDAAKEIVYGRLRIQQPGPGYCHFPSGRDPAWFEQLTSEIVVTKYSKGFPVREWVPRPNTRQEALDCRVYAFAALRSMSISWGRVQRLLAARERTPAPSEASSAPSPSTPAIPSVAVAAQKAPRRMARSSFMNG